MQKYASGNGVTPQKNNKVSAISLQIRTWVGRKLF